MERRWLLRDARGKYSWTATIIVPSIVAVTQKFLLAGLAVPVLGTFPPMNGAEYAAAVGALLGLWVYREQADKRNGPEGPGGASGRT